MYRSFVLVAVLAANTSLNAQSPSPAEDTTKLYARKSLQAVRISGYTPAIDGKLDEPVWQTAPAGTDFVQLEPNPGQPSSQKTEIRFAYDDHAIYVAARMFDSAPDSIVAQLARRDNDVYSDWVFVAIDSYYDRRTGFAFAVNPKGVKVDILLFDDTDGDESWDAVWDAEARIDSLGWTAEFRIPLSQLRFSVADQTTGAPAVWGMNVLRKIARHDEESFWSPLRADANAVVSAFGDLTGISGLETPRRMEVVPYTMSRLVRAPGENGNPFFQANDAAFGIGADIKAGVTSDLTLTATLNPDFGQVEADPSEVNLTAFETFFSEKRPFFVEGLDIFRASISAGDGGNEGLFYSRRIGRSPQGDVPNVATYADAPQNATILGAAKLSGKTRSGWSIGALSATTARESAEFVMADDSRAAVVVEPLTHYGVARVIRDLDKGQSALGAVFTATNRQLPNNLSFLRANAYSGGVNGRKRWQNGDYQLSAFLYGSQVNGDTAAIHRTQRSSARYFQRPDNDYADYDPARTSLTGASGGVEFFKMGGGHWRYAAALNARTPEFEINDLGFMPSADQVFQAAFVGYQQYQPGKRLNNWKVNVNQWTTWTFGGEKTALAGNINGHASLKNTADFWYGASRDQEALSVTALRGGPALKRPANTQVWAGYDSDERKPLNWWLDFNYRNEDETNGYRFGISPGLRVRASNQLELRLRPGVSWSRNPWQYVDEVSSGGSAEYVFATLNQVTTSLTARVNYTFTPDLSLQVYAEPFVSAGNFSEFKEVTNPRGASFADRFRPLSASEVEDYDVGNPDFNFRALRSNVVLRWEYRPGSSLFLVWSQGRERSADYGDYSFSRDASRLFGAMPTNVLLIKASYWLGL
ncbi:MAG: DUF5916 domain-containing protein [Gemmatimonadota bacterium]